MPTKTKATPKQTTPAAPPLAAPIFASITKKAPEKRYDPTDPNAPLPSPESRKLGGTYRVIHGRIAIPRSPEEIAADLSMTPTMTTYAQIGDEVLLGHKDAALMLDAGVIEALDAKPSRCGKVWTPPRVLNQLNAAAAGR